MFWIEFLGVSLEEEGRKEGRKEERKKGRNKKNKRDEKKNQRKIQDCFLRIYKRHYEIRDTVIIVYFSCPLKKTKPNSRQKKICPSVEPDSNQRPKDVSEWNLYSLPLYQLSYRRSADRHWRTIIEIKHLI